VSENAAERVIRSGKLIYHDSPARDVCSATKTWTPAAKGAAAPKPIDGPTLVLAKMQTTRSIR
jgi:hypothetical protein